MCLLHPYNDDKRHYCFCWVVGGDHQNPMRTTERMSQHQPALYSIDNIISKLVQRIYYTGHTYFWSCILFRHLTVDFNAIENLTMQH